MLSDFLSDPEIMKRFVSGILIFLGPTVSSFFVGPWRGRYLLNFVLNAVAERFSGSAVQYDAGQPLKPVTYLLFLTCEVLGDDRIRKVRVLMLRKDLMEEFPFADVMPKLEQKWHRDRVLT